MRSVEISAPTLEEAHKAAAFQLGVGEDELEIEVLQEPRKLLGLISSGQCRIRATYDEERAAGAETPTDIEMPREAPAGEQEPEATGALEVEVAEPEAVSEQTEHPPPQTPPTEQPADAKRAVAERAKQLTEDITKLMGTETQVTITEVGDEQVELSIAGDESIGLLIGQHGRTLDALQLVVAIGANKGIHDGCRVILDTAEGYRARHEEQLRRRAHEAAQEAKQTGREVVIFDLEGYERRIMHMALYDDPEVTTYSEGEGRRRRFVVAPVTEQ